MQHQRFRTHIIMSTDNIGQKQQTFVLLKIETSLLQKHFASLP